MTTQTPSGSAPIPELVVRGLTRIAIIGLIIGGSLVVLALTQPGKVDATVIGVIGAVLALPTAAVGALGAILASTRSPADPPQPVTVTNQPADPVLTADVDQPRPAKKTTRHRPRQSGITDLQAVFLVLLAVGAVVLVGALIW